MKDLINSDSKAIRQKHTRSPKNCRGASRERSIANREKKKSHQSKKKDHRTADQTIVRLTMIHTNTRLLTNHPIIIHLPNLSHDFNLPTTTVPSRLAATRINRRIKRSIFTARSTFRNKASRGSPFRKMSKKKRETDSLMVK
jgi:hypothetical protein